MELVMDENYNVVNVHQIKESELDIDKGYDKLLEKNQNRQQR